MNNLIWGTCDNNLWCGLHTLNVSADYFDNLEGVYVIWYWDRLRNPITVRVGQGEIRDRVYAHRIDPDIQEYRIVKQFPPRPLPEYRTLYFTWAEVSQKADRLGIERYLANTLKPLVGQYPNVYPITANLPPWKNNC